MKRKQYFILYKVGFALLGFSAVITEIIVLNQRELFNSANFFSFFTVQSNVFIALMLLVGAYSLDRGKRSASISFLRGAATLYMVMTGVIFAVLLSGIDPRLLTAVPWDNTVLHYIMPIVALLDWIVDRPDPKVKMKQAFVWLIVPLAYVAYTLLRGMIVGWYPYPFLNPSVVGGYSRIAIICIIITLFVLLAMRLIVGLQYLNVQASRRRVS